MPEHLPIYRRSFVDAKLLNELSRWRASQAENIRCRDFLDQLVRDNFDGMHLQGNLAEQAVTRFGFDRVQWVLANHIQHYDHDGRFHAEIKRWANEQYIPRPVNPERRDPTLEYLLTSHSVLVDALAGHVRELYAGLHLFGHQHCEQTDNYEGKLLVLRDTALREAYRTPENQLFFAESGFDCHAETGGKVFGYFLIDGARDSFRRKDFYGVLDDQYLPAWAAQKLEERQFEQEPQQELTMGGLE